MGNEGSNQGIIKEKRSSYIFSFLIFQPPLHPQPMEAGPSKAAVEEQEGNEAAGVNSQVNINCFQGVQRSELSHKQVYLNPSKI